MTEPGPLEVWMKKEAQHLEMGRLLKERGLDAVEANSDKWVERMRFHARNICKARGQVTCDDLRRQADITKDQPHSPHAWGSIFRGKGWVCTGRTQSNYGSNHAREIRTWRWEGE